MTGETIPAGATPAADEACFCWHRRSDHKGRGKWPTACTFLYKEGPCACNQFESQEAQATGQSN